MEWIKKGHIYKPTGKKEWSKSHAQVPIPDFIESENIIRVYFSTRDTQGRSLPDYIDLDADNPSIIVNENTKPILDLGNLGTFDDCGVMPTWILNYDSKKYLYYIGWNVRNTIPYHNSIGLAISNDDGKTFSKFSEGPLWDRNFIEPHYSGTCCVLFHEGIWKNWYLSCTGWFIVEGKPEPRYHIKYAESLNGITWERKGIVAIDYKSEQEAGIVKSSVIIENGIYKMWYSYRLFKGYRTNKSSSYRIGYAESIDGVNWSRFDERMSSLDVSKNTNDWDGIMVEYPHVIDVKGQRIMFYNGNGFGETGFGYAILSK